MSLGEIIRHKREKLAYTLDDVSHRTGVSKPYLSTIETGRVKNPPSDDVIVRLERVLEFESGTLLRIAHMERLSPDMRAYIEGIEADAQKMRRILCSLAARPNGARNLDELVNREEFNQLAAKGENVSPAITPGTLVPVINKVSAGYPHGFTDLGYPARVADEYTRCPDVHDENAFAAYVCGDSMEPVYREGDMVMFSPAAEIRDGDDCYVRFEETGESTFKRIFFEDEDSIRLQPRNERYPPLTVAKDRIAGMYRAIRQIRRLDR